nr:Replication fork protection component Swi3 domain containing protein [Haemonchus contortus]
MVKRGKCRCSNCSRLWRMIDDSEEFDEPFGNDYSDGEQDDLDAGVSNDQVLNNLVEKENQEVKKKRTISRPQPKLDVPTLTGPKGIQALRDSFKNFSPDIKKDPYDNLSLMMKKYEHWAHVMFPKLKFEDVINRCEVLGDKRPVKVYMMKSRLGMPLTDEDFAPIRRKKDDIIHTENIEDDVPSESGESEDENIHGFPERATFKGKSSGENNAQKLSSASATTAFTSNSVSNEVDNDLLESAELTRKKAMEEEQRRRDEEELALADEIMEDFDMY